jgi:hypothetical protein
MFLHVGGDLVVRVGELVAILDRRSADTSAATREFVGFMGTQGRVEDVSQGEVKSIVVCSERVVLSPISAGTLRRRVGVLEDLR